MSHEVHPGHERATLRCQRMRALRLISNGLHHVLTSRATFQQALLGGEARCTVTDLVTSRLTARCAMRETRPKVVPCLTARRTVNDRVRYSRPRFQSTRLQSLQHRPGRSMIAHPHTRAHPSTHSSPIHSFQNPVPISDRALPAVLIPLRYRPRRSSFPPACTVRHCSDCCLFVPASRPSKDT
jgi:hypothetical protein